ncbi:uncharacterized protein C8A04DRAFT_10519 [Dichotomopilus funicola]|uniref:S-adenosyl-L-methionine-dependent methyltransferase n=1 Tax=Dichotomopilus funicola TaxID=1934379 RepID=A0AAN6V6G6_9PEZI|nr:hypothetical protein C8A04DRAFT_10519 [Dichotomopilus funicola]
MISDSLLTLNPSSSSSVSVSASVYKFVQEHGRTFHRYKEGKYFIPNDEREQQRMDYQHAISKVLLGGKLGLAPVGTPKQVLDLGTGTGIWAIEFAEENPASQILGTDLSPIQPEYIPPNCRFEIDDLDDDWVYSHKFDYIHGRGLLPFIKTSWDKLFRTVHDNLEPGGWAEFQETVPYARSIDNSIEGTALQRWNTLLLQGMQKLNGRVATEALRCKSYLADAGFVNLGEKKFAVPLNTWAKGKEQKALGAMQMVNNLEAVDGITMAVFTRAFGWATEEVDNLLADLKRDLQDRTIHAYCSVVVAWGQKPH